MEPVPLDQCRQCQGMQLLRSRVVVMRGRPGHRVTQPQDWAHQDRTKVSLGRALIALGAGSHRTRLPCANSAIFSS